jgi:hypothetical protein
VVAATELALDCQAPASLACALGCDGAPELIGHASQANARDLILGNVPEVLERHDPTVIPKNAQRQQTHHLVQIYT